jgi:site-specific DNA recombinase
VSDARKAVIYARFSSELQKERSIDDQVALCREFAQRHGWEIAGVYADRAVSGTSTHGRNEYARMCRDGEAHRYDIILAEDLDRLGRKQADTSSLRERMEFLGIEVHTVADGRITKLHSGLRGLMSELFIDNLSLHIKRGLRGVVRDGRYPGGRAYGYRPTQARGVFEIVPEEAAVIRRIFDLYSAGETPRSISACPQRRARATSTRQDLECVDDQRQQQARLRNPAQHALRGPAGVEQVAQGPRSRHRTPSEPPQSGKRVVSNRGTTLANRL